MGGPEVACPCGKSAANPQFPHDTESQPFGSKSQRHGDASKRSLHGIALLALVLLFSVSYRLRHKYWHHGSSCPPPEIDVPAILGIELPKEVQQAWAQYSPYFPAVEYYVPPPERCEVVQVNLLQRHGARFPTAGGSKRIKKPLQKLINAGSYTGKKYEFLRDFEWDLGVSDLLPFGEREAFHSGSEHYLRYKHLVDEDRLPFVRASDSKRVVHSAINWTQGFSTASEHMYSPIISVIISEEKGANNTLDDSMCLNAKSYKQPGKAWRDKFTPPIAERINKAVRGARLDNNDIAELMPLCAFETVFHEIASPFCGLFTEEEWQAREYYDDLLKYYKTGHGNSLGPVQGVGYVNELLARLTGEPVCDETQTNRTLDASPETFPLNRTFYADFSHDNQMVAIYSAIGLFRPDEPPITDRLDISRRWRISRMTPFSGRMITEKLLCASDFGDFEEYVRILVNDAVQPLDFCNADKDGLCTLVGFVESQAYAQGNGKVQIALALGDTSIDISWTLFSASDPPSRSLSAMLFDVSRKLFSRSDRVKGTDFHPTEPWLLTGLYNGSVNIYNHDTGALVKTFEVSNVPVRCVKFISRKNWFVAGSDDFQLRVFNYNTHDKVAAFEAHPDYIRCLAVHPTAGIVLTGSDDMTIKAWDWDKGWKCIQTYEGHSHYIMNITFNPKDANTFASACLDRTVKMWSLGSAHANFTMDAHDKGVNYVDFYPGPDKPYLVTTGDDKTIKVWDYLSKSCVQTMEGHTNNPSFAVFHPNLPIIISGSEDGTIKIWNSNTYRLENTLSYALERAWCVALRRDANEVAVGFDEGIVVIKLGRDEPTFSMDPTGKLIYTRNQVVLLGNVQSLSDDKTAEGNRIPLPTKEIGTTEIFATNLIHSPNGRFVTVVGDGEYIIYTALAWRNKSFGNGLSFAWAGDSNTYAVLESKLKLKVYKNFKERGGAGIKGAGSWSIDGLHGGPVLGARGKGFVVFWDWESGEIVRRIDVDAKNIHWSGTGTLVAIASEESFYVLRFDRDAYNAKLEEGVEVTDEGIEEAFDVVSEVSDNIMTAKWVGDCFIYTTAGNRVNYFVGNESYTISPSDTPLYMLGYIPAHNRVYLSDKDMNVYGYALSLSVVEYQTAVLRGDMDAAAEILPTLPKEQLNKVARFLEGRDLKELAMQVTNDPDHKFDLSLQLDDLDAAVEIVRSVPENETETKWKALGDRALTVWRFDLAREAFERANDLSALMLLLLSTGDREGLERFAETAEQKGVNNLAFATFFQLGNTKACVDLLVKTNRAPEAALFARTYAPSQVPQTVDLWRTELRNKNKPKIAESVAHPGENTELFEEGWEEALEREEEVRAVHEMVDEVES